MEKISKHDAESLIEKYLDLANEDYFNLEVKHPIYKVEEKKKMLLELEAKALIGELPYEEIYSSLEPDAYEVRRLKLVVLREQTKEHEENWSIHYQTNLYLETENPIYSVFGYGKFLVDKYIGSVFITPSGYNEDFWSRDYKNCKRNTPREMEMGWTWNSLDLNKMNLKFLIYGPVKIYRKE